MSRAVLISIRPKWCELIASGEKTIEVRKTRPKIETPFKCYIYCTKFHPGDPDSMINLKGRTSFFMPKGGAVIGEFVCDQVFPITVEENGPFSEERGGGYSEDYSAKGFHDCLTDEEFDAYLSGKPGYGWHISDLVIYDKPKRICDFVRPACERVSDCGSGCPYWTSSVMRCTRNYTVLSVPQNWMYVEELE